MMSIYKIRRQSVCQFCGARYDPDSPCSKKGDAEVECASKLLKVIEHEEDDAGIMR